MDNLNNLLDEADNIAEELEIHHQNVIIYHRISVNKVQNLRDKIKILRNKSQSQVTDSETEEVFQQLEELVSPEIPLIYSKTNSETKKSNQNLEELQDDSESTSPVFLTETEDQAIKPISQKKRKFIRSISSDTPVAGEPCQKMTEKEDKKKRSAGY